MEAWTADGRRRSDVAVTFPGGARLAIEVQLGKITDSELLARRDDYTRSPYLSRSCPVECAWSPRSKGQWGRC